MKKNLRIASAAAAALLAVAPVAASAVNTTATVAQAATTAEVPGVIVLNPSVNTVFSVSLNDTQKASVLKQLGFAPEVAANLDVAAKATKSTNPSEVNGEFTQELVFTVTKKDGSAFQDAHGLTLSKDNKSLTANGTATARFAAQQGTPTFFNKTTNKTIVDGSTVELSNLANGINPGKLADMINAKYGYYTTNSAYDAAKLVTSENDIESQLVNQGLKRLPNGDFDYPANGFNLKLTAVSDNGETTSITVRVNSKVNYNAPVFVVGTDVYYDGDVVKSVQKVDLNKSFDTKAFLKGLLVYVQSATKEGYDSTADELKRDQKLLADEKVSVDTSAVNTAVAGVYNVVVTATNPAGFTSKLYVPVQVGEPGQAVSYVTADTTPVYSINGNVVTETKDTKKKGDSVVAYGKVTVNGVEYTRISKDDNSQWVKSSDLSLTAPATEVTTTKTIWHVAKIYDKDGKATSEAKLHAYNTVSVVSTPVTISGAKYYKLAGKDQYVKAGNIDGTSRTLSHNAYVYKNTGKAKTTKSGKKTKKVVLKKGSQVTTYGSAFTVNGHKMFRIGKNQYVKVANF